MTDAERDKIRELRDELREVRARLSRYDGFISRLLCPTCYGDRFVALSHDPCSETILCPTCNPTEPPPP